MERVLGGVLGRTLSVKAEWGESILGHGDGGSSRAGNEGESTNWGAGSVDSDAASECINGSLCYVLWTPRFFYFKEI